MYRQTAFTIVCCGLPLAAFGRQRRQARKPALSASCGLAKKVTFSRRGRLDGHDGRQYTPVDETANTKLPSLAPSRFTTACQRESSVNVAICNCSGALLNKYFDSCSGYLDSKINVALFMSKDYAGDGICAIRILRSN